MTLRIVCPNCQGRGVEWIGSNLDECRACSGRGWLPVSAILRDGIFGLALFVALAVMVVVVAP